jgi:hypothetical protein
MDLVSGMLGALLTTWTIRAALVCYAVYVALALTVNKPNLARAVWTAGCMLFVVHVACAFHFYHHWSHQAAWQKTAEETESILGVAFGDGIYFSYLFLVLWVADVVWLWTFGSRSLRSPETIGSPHSRSARSATAVPLAAGGYRMPKWRLAVHGFLLFIAVNGAIIFEGGVTRVVGVPVVLALTGLAVWRASKPSRPVRELPPRERIHKDTDRDYITTASG